MVGTNIQTWISWDTDVVQKEKYKNADLKALNALIRTGRKTRKLQLAMVNDIGLT
jgi:hypothetical protein